MDININQEFNSVEIVSNDDKTKPTSMDFMLMDSSVSNQRMKITVHFTQKFKEIAFEMLEKNIDNHEILLEELKNNIKLFYQKNDIDKNWNIDLRPSGDNVGYLE